MTKRRVRGNGDGSIVKLSGKRAKPFGVRITTGWDKNGKQIRKYLGYYKNKTEAKIALSNYLINPYDLNSNELSTQDIFDKWAENTKVSENVIKAYQGIVKNSGLANLTFKEIKLTQLEESVSKFTPSMQRRFRDTFKNLYEYAMRHELVNKDLSSLIELDKYKASKRESISQTDIKKILKGEDVIPIILLYTGLRIGELLDIKSKNVDIKSRIMIGGLKTEAGRDRKIPIHKNILPIVKKLLSEGNEYLISKNGKKIKYNDYYRNVWNQNPVLIPYTPHFTRHTMISRAVKLELNQEVLKAVVGHSSSDVTSSVYTHVDSDQLIDFIDKFNYEKR